MFDASLAAVAKMMGANLVNEFVGRMRTIWDLVLLPLWAWISKISPGLEKRGNNLTMDAIEKRAGGMPSTMQMMNGKVAQGCDRFLYWMKLIC